MFYIKIHNHAAAIKRVRFLAFTKTQAFLILTGYGIIYESDPCNVWINGRLLNIGDFAGNDAWQRELNRRFRRKEFPAL